jgi:hypothetical protein
MDWVLVTALAAVFLAFQLGKAAGRREDERTLSRLFATADARDWDHLFAVLRAGGHGFFWGAILMAVRDKIAK